MKVISPVSKLFCFPFLLFSALAVSKAELLDSLDSLEIDLKTFFSNKSFFKIEHLDNSDSDFTFPTKRPDYEVTETPRQALMRKAEKTKAKFFN